MAYKLSNINDLFRVKSDGAIEFGTSGAGTATYVLTSAGANASPTWTEPTIGTVTGSGTGQKVSKWDGTGSGKTAITDGPITFSTDDSTFDGNVTIDATANSAISSKISNLNTGSASQSRFIAVSDGGNIQLKSVSIANTTYGAGDAGVINCDTMSGGFRIAHNDVTKYTLAFNGDNTWTGGGTFGNAIRINATTTTGLVIASSSSASNGLKLYNDSVNDNAYIYNHFSGNLEIGTSNATVLTMNGTTSTFVGNITAPTLNLTGLTANATSTTVLVKDETLGPELVSNPNFTTGVAGWNLQNSSTVTGGIGTINANGSLSSTGGNWSIYQTAVFTPNKKYLANYTVRRKSGTGKFQIAYSYGIFVNQTLTSSFQTFSIYYNTNGNAWPVLTLGGDTSGDVFEISYISVKQVTSISDQIKSREIGSGAFSDELWAVTPTDTNNIYNLNSGNVGIGTTSVNEEPGFFFDTTNNYLSINKWTASTATPAAMLHLFGKDNNINVPQIIIEGRDNPGDTRLEIAVKDPQVRFLLEEGTDAPNGYGLMTFETTAAPNAAASERGGFDFDLPGGTAMTITNTANVGIGTDSPTARLDVLTSSTSGINSIDRHVRFRADNGEQRFDFEVGRSGNSAVLGIYNASETKTVQISTASDSYFNGGDVGIGTTNPSYKLDAIVNDAATNTVADVIRVSHTTTGTPATGLGAGILFNVERVSSSVNLSRAAIYGVSGPEEGNQGDFVVYTRTDTGVNDPTSGMNEKFRITARGNIGQAVLPITDPYITAGDDAEQWQTYQIGKAGVFGAYKKNNESMFGFNTYTAAPSGNNKAIVSALNGTATRYYADRISFHQLTTTAATGIQAQAETMRISTDGALTLGNSLLGGNKRFLMTSADNAVNYDIDFQQAGTTNHGRIRYTEGASDLLFFPITGQVANLTLAFNGDSYFQRGNVGIGETTLQRKFNLFDATDAWTRVRCGASADWIFGANGSDHTFKWYNQSSNGGVGYKMAIATSGTLTVSSDIVAYGSPSDKRLKENIKPIESALDKVSKLQGVTFDWKKSDSILDIKEDIGFIAQDVQKVVPELVRENEDGMLSMRHQGIAPILLEAIKELKAEIEELKSKLCNCK